MENTMNYYLIDYENVRSDMMEIFDEMSEGCAVAIFYSEQSKSISLDIIERLMSLNIRLSCHRVKTGTKNALDFQLSSHLGYIFGKESKAICHIVSNDKGFDCLCDFWRGQGKAVDRIGVAEQAKETKASQTTQQEIVEPKKKDEHKIKDESKKKRETGKKHQEAKKKKATKKQQESKQQSNKEQKNDLASIDEINNLLTTADEPETVLTIFNQNKSRQAICNDMAKKFRDSKRASEIYRKLKPLLKEKHKS